MTREDIIRMAREAGDWNGQTAEFNDIGLERFADIVAAHEREECRLIVLDNSDAEGICCTDDVLEAFRQMGEKLRRKTVDKEDLIYRLRKRAEIRRQINTRKSVQEGAPDRIADLLEEAADALESKEKAHD
jgi:hypothetical protein